MQQRASICRALIHEPKMLLLDEPFGALDAFTREELWCILRDLWTEQRFNVILVTHDLRESVFLADTVYVMSKSPGRFVVKTRNRPAAPARPRNHLHKRIHRHRARVARAYRRLARNGSRRRSTGGHGMKRTAPRTLGAVGCCSPGGDRAVAADLQRLQRFRVHLSQPVAHLPTQTWWSSSGIDCRPRVAHLLGDDGRLSASRSSSACCSASSSAARGWRIRRCTR